MKIKMTFRGAKTGQLLTIRAHGYAPDTALRQFAASLGALWDEDIDIIGENRTGDRIAHDPSATDMGDSLSDMQY